MYIGLHVSTDYSSQILMKLEFSRQIFDKYSKTKFHWNLSCGSRFVPCGRTNRHMTKLIVLLGTLRKRLKLGPYLRENTDLN